ncbi:phytanoyl-CoA dioxygenase family protein [Kitasatospora viridis]|uniref:Phytanoyl-CoA dioxygenase PhyH n=1 Tax=Kitasatospora viridis TaxID=281105 RepID=A0A561UIS7_9ACTN|nr:phytanoyl-CoA dioxygenase family protein [Kitasatospora viridis]TWF99256.1 phytanoyl-CoA dioxygenase PhyH [Kitasatospora viridis]
MSTTDQQVFVLTEEELALLPSEEDVHFYQEHGWYLSKKLLSDEETALLEKASEDFYAGHRDRRLPVRPPKLAYWEPSAGGVQRHNDYIHYEDDRIGAILRKPLIGAVAALLTGTSSIRIFQSTLIYKPPAPEERSNIVPWHFDRHYWATCSSERMLTAFIPFHDCTEELGTITMVDGSHRWKETAENDRTSLHFAERDNSELDVMLAENAEFNGVELKKLPITIPRGHMNFHHCRTYHGSGANVGEIPRRAISLHLQDGENQYRPFTRSDGSEVSYNHDVLVRRTADGLPDYADPAYCPTTWQS